MKTLILYASKHGTTKDTAMKINEYLKNSDVYDIQKEEIKNLQDYDCVILGSALYAGNIIKKAKDFLKENETQLLEKKLGFFLCGLNSDGGESYFSKNFNKTLLDRASMTRFIGGKFDLKELNLLERTIMKLLYKDADSANTISEDKIEEFCNGMR